MADATPTEPQSPSQPRRLVTTRVAADYCGVGLAGIRRWIYEGHLRAYRVGPGRTIRVDMNDVEAMVKPR